jgi:glycosyltransferase involved in cell wall biosynthesis
MKKYILEPQMSNQFHAGSKAREDINYFLGNDGFEIITFKVNESKSFLTKVKNYLSFFANINSIVAKVKPNSLALIQYPYNHRAIVLDSIFKRILKKNVKVVALVHDIDTLRFERPDKEIKREIHRLNSFHHVISHNPIMTEWLISKGLKKSVLDLEVFDYRMNELKQEASKAAEAVVESFNNIGRSVVFAGNLSPNKSKFLYEFTDDMLSDLNLNLYGIEYDENNVKSKSVSYKGVFQPDELPHKMEGNFGLIWDGEELNTCSGHFGQYLRFNNPHKLSLYMAAGIPVVTWKKAAISELISKNKIGILVDSLTEIADAISEVSDENYQEMKANISDFNKKVTSGHFIQSIVRKIEDNFNKENENV